MSIPQLAYETKIVHIIDYKDFDKFVNAHYGVTQYKIAANEETGNDVTLASSAVPTELDEDEVEDLEEFRQTNGVRLYMFHIIIQDFVNKGILPPGEFNVKISW